MVKRVPSPSSAPQSQTRNEGRRPSGMPIRATRRELQQRLPRQSPKPVAALLDRTRSRSPAIRIDIRPADRCRRTEPFQRDLSDAHHKRLADVINKTGRFLDPINAVVAPKRGFWTPNGCHRLEAMRRLGAKSITALVVADCEVAWQILALNTEKAHTLKERSLEVIRIYRGLVDEDAARPESQFAFYLDQSALITLDVCYERVPRFGGTLSDPTATGVLY